MKSNNTMSVQSDSSSYLLSQPFRQLVHNLSLQPIELDANKLNRQISHSVTAQKDLLVAQSKDPKLAARTLVADLLSKQSITSKVNKKTIVVEALRSQNNPYARFNQSIESFKQL